MINPHLLIAQLDSASLVTPAEANSVQIVTIGFLFVMIVLAALAVVTAIIGLFFSRSAASHSAERATVPVIKAASAASSMAADPALLAVIAGAVHASIGDRPHRLVSIDRDGQEWAQEGRRQIFSSHRVR